MILIKNTMSRKETMLQIFHSSSKMAVTKRRCFPIFWSDSTFCQLYLSLFCVYDMLVVIQQKYENNHPASPPVTVPCKQTSLWRLLTVFLYQRVSSPAVEPV